MCRKSKANVALSKLPARQIDETKSERARLCVDEKDASSVMSSVNTINSKLARLKANV